MPFRLWLTRAMCRKCDFLLQVPIAARSFRNDQFGMAYKVAREYFFSFYLNVTLITSINWLLRQTNFH